MKYFIKENDWLFKNLPTSYRNNIGWGNGYVAIPKNHFLYGLDYDEIHNIININVHGGLTFSNSYENCKHWKEVTEEYKDCWIIGFDTAHYGDNIYNCSKEYVLSETIKLRDYILNDFKEVNINDK